MQGEISVLCPFPHDKGYERNPSAHVNLAKVKPKDDSTTVDYLKSDLFLTYMVYLMKKLSEL